MTILIITREIPIKLESRTLVACHKRGSGYYGRWWGNWLDQISHVCGGDGQKHSKKPNETVFSVISWNSDVHVYNFINKRRNLQRTFRARQINILNGFELISDFSVWWTPGSFQLIIVSLSWGREAENFLPKLISSYKFPSSWPRSWANFRRFFVSWKAE